MQKYTATKTTSLKDKVLKDRLLSYISNSTVNGEVLTDTLLAIFTSLKSGDTSAVDLLTTISTTLTDSSTSIPETIGHISNATVSDATATQISTDSHECKKCIITASENNTGFIRVGGSTLSTSTGFLLYAGESMELEISNTNILYAIAEIDEEDITVTYMN